MLKLQRMILTLVSIVLLGFTLALIVQNMDVFVPVRFFSWNATELSVGGWMGVASLMLGLSILAKMWERILMLGTQQKRTNRELERRDVSKEGAEAQVKVLESKVQTLEKALQEALKIK